MIKFKEVSFILNINNNINLTKIMTVEEKALIWARKQNGNVLSNRNVDCFIAGYNMAAKEYKEAINKGYKKIFAGLPDKLEKQLEDDEVGLGYCGYMYSYPDWFIKKKSAYTALRDALKQCEEFTDNITSLL